jgi:hypothetical protein
MESPGIPQWIGIPSRKIHKGDLESHRDSMRIKSEWKHPISVVLQYLNKPVDAIYRVLNVVNGIPEWEEGFLQLKFADQSWLLLTGDSDGETFLAKPERWHDPSPSEGSLDDGTDVWIKENGDYELIAVSSLDQYRGLIGKPLTGIKGILYQIGAEHGLCGVQLIFEDKVLNFVYVNDECFVKETLQNPPFEIVDTGLILNE